MNDVIPIAIFIGCLFATFGLARVCEWLRPAAPAQRSAANAGSTLARPHEEAAR